MGGQANQIKQQTYLPGGNCNGTRNRKQTEFEQLKLEDWRSGGLKDRTTGDKGPIAWGCWHQERDIYSVCVSSRYI